MIKMIFRQFEISISHITGECAFNIKVIGSDVHTCVYDKRETSDCGPTSGGQLE